MPPNGRAHAASIAIGLGVLSVAALLLSSDARLLHAPDTEPSGSPPIISLEPVAHKLARWKFPIGLLIHQRDWFAPQCSFLLGPTREGEGAIARRHDHAAASAIKW